ncbi:MAG: hypothetical protein PHY23_01040 [Oscillospiraceae bacterium]|nr:hypothetical protein [Oscillospiraceae bacterium]
MKQLGNLAIVCAMRPEMCLQLYAGQVSVHIGEGPARSTMSAQWDDDEKINAMIYELNFGQYARQGKENAA